MTLGIFGFGDDPSPADCGPTEEWDPQAFTCVTKGQTINASSVTTLPNDEDNSSDTFCPAGQYWDIFQEKCLPGYKPPAKTGGGGGTVSRPSGGTTNSSLLDDLKFPLILGVAALGIWGIMSLASSKKSYTSNRRRARRS